MSEYKGYEIYQTRGGFYFIWNFGSDEGGAVCGPYNTLDEAEQALDEHFVVRAIVLSEAGAA